ncbi:MULTISPECIES: spermidine synthase [unclassified Streptomyces]|uniref:spermidine synthase n=1 Tax=unclassified Streptomyces TaxID=2593676 RepID=UPI0004C55697|nr:MULTISPECIES: fused MFS/spermidine synthase [unclassified Streptomyces]MDX2728317.1 fused MFS/spermidine synthase [Streptomyces sp. PA03-2a]MDX3769347.1 fused MFS/spermidine synthase [Streptomyces sp. AK08-01B]MDX3818411.1 fused MFS/spermidine synthase [Streptomyces sp. AK08-01A]SCZ07583.1 Spermine/spermidine synthase [Streptomyces sp. 136MFCol5.1]SFT19453.1 Spermine/spermidine synthase [Streptomyces sp. ok210]
MARRGASSGGAGGRKRADRKSDRKPETLSETVDGGLAELIPDRERPHAWTLTLDGAPQSHVDLDDPSHLSFAYQRRIGHIADLTAPAGQPLHVVHLGGGAFTLARYVAATRPRSTQQIVELDAALVQLVRRELPLDPQARIRVRSTDARAGLGKIPDDWADLVIADVFSGARTPAHLTSAEFLTDVRRVLKPAGQYVANLADGPPLAHLRGQIATAATVFPELALAADPAVLRGRRFGNAVLLASALPLKVAELTRRVATDPHPGRVEHGKELADFTGGAAAVSDADARPSPAPPPSAFE